MTFPAHQQVCLSRFCRHVQKTKTPSPRRRKPLNLAQLESPFLITRISKQHHG
jgi:hypothetical protein